MADSGSAERGFGGRSPRSVALRRLAAETPAAHAHVREEQHDEDYGEDDVGDH
jgi:hypothetical protein